MFIFTSPGASLEPMVPEPEAPEHPTAPDRIGAPLRLSASDKRQRIPPERHATDPLYLDDDAVIEIMLEADGVVWAEKAGSAAELSRDFNSARSVAEKTTSSHGW